MRKILLTIFSILQFVFANGQLSWLQLPDYPGHGLKGLASFSINGKGYMGLGLDSAGNGPIDFYEYDAALNTWTRKADFPSSGRWGTTCFVISGKGYVVGGDNGGVLNQTWEYDPSSNSWTSKANLPVSRESAAGFSIADKGYIGTGYAGGNSYTDFYEFDPVLNTWTQKSSFPGSPRNGCSYFNIGNKGYIGMGNGNQSVTYPFDFYEYDPSNDTWTSKADFPHILNSTVNYSTNVAGYVLCGYYFQYGNTITHNPMNMLYKYDQATDVWSLEVTFPGYPRGYSAGYVLGNDMYIGTGGQKNLIGEGMRDYWKLANGTVLMIGNASDPTVDFVLSPNPVKTELTFSLLNNISITHLRIYNVTGQLIYSVKLRDDQDKLNVSFLKPGLYFVEAVTKNKEVLDSKFIKE